MLPPSQRVLYQSDENTQLKGFIKALETTIDISQFGAMGATALTGVATNKKEISNSVANSFKASTPVFKTLETTVKDLSSNIQKFIKAGGIEKIFAPFKAIADGLKGFTPKVIKDLFSTFKPLQELLTDVVKSASPILKEFFKNISNFSKTIYDAAKIKLGGFAQSGGTQTTKIVDNKLQSLSTREKDLTKELQDLNQKYQNNLNTNKKTPIPEYDKVQDGLKTKSATIASEIKENDKLLKQYDELLASKNKLYQIDVDIKKLRLANSTANAQELAKLESLAKREIAAQKQLVKNLQQDLKPEELTKFKNEQIIRNAERKTLSQASQTSKQLDAIKDQKKALSSNLGADDAGNVSVKGYKANQAEIAKLTLEEEKLSKVLQEQETVLKGLNKARTEATEVTLNNVDDALKLGTELNKATVSMQNLGQAFQTYVKITDTFLTGTSLAKAFITLSEGIQDVTRSLNDAESALLLMQKQGFDISGFDELNKIKDILTLNTEVATDFVTSTVARFNEFEENLRRVGTVFETDLNMEERTASLQEFGTTIQNLVNNNLGNAVTETEALAATYEALSAGFTTASSSTQVMEAGLKLAAASGADSGEVMRLLSKTLNAYGKDASEASKVAAQLNTIVENGITTVDELSGGFGQLSTVASAVGINLEETGAALAVLTTKGTSTAQAMTQLQSLFTAFIDPEFDKRLEDLKIDFEVNKAVVESKGLVTVLKELDTAIGGNAVKWGQLLPEIQAYRAALSLTSDGVTKLESVTQKMVDTTAQKLEDVFNIRLDGSQITKFTAIVNKLNSTLINVGRSLAPIMEQSIDFVAGFSQHLSKYVEGNLGLIKAATTLTLTLKGFEGVAKSLIGTLGGLLGIFTTWRFLTGKLLPDLGSLFVVSKKGMETMMTAQQNGAKAFELFGIALRNNALLTNENLTVFGKLKVVLGNLTGLGAKTGADIQVLGQATGETAEQFKRLTSGNMMGNLGQGLKDLGSAIKNGAGTAFNFLKDGIKNVSSSLWSFVNAPIIPSGVAAFGALAAAAYGLSKGFEIIEKQKEGLKTALRDIQESIKDTSQTLDNLSFGKLRIEDLSSDEITAQLRAISEIPVNDGQSNLKKEADKFIQQNKANLEELKKLQEERDALLSKPVPDNSPQYQDYTDKLKGLNDNIAKINSSLTSQLSKDLEIRLLVTKDNLEQLLDNEQEYLQALKDVDEHYGLHLKAIASKVGNFFSENVKAASDFGFAIQDSLNGVARFFDDIFGGNLGEKIQIDKNVEVLDKIGKDLNALMDANRMAIEGSYKYTNLVIDGKKVEVDLQKELNNLWKEQGNIQDENYSKFVKTIEAIREELDFQSKVIKKNIELINVSIQANDEKISKNYSLENVLNSKQNQEYSKLTNDEERKKYLKGNLLPYIATENNSAVKNIMQNTNFGSEVAKLTQNKEFLELENEKDRVDYLDKNLPRYSLMAALTTDRSEANRESVIKNLAKDENIKLLKEEDLNELEKRVISGSVNERGQQLYSQNEQLKQQLAELKKINANLEKANTDLDLIAKAGSILNNRVDVNRLDAVAERKTQNFNRRQEKIDNTLSAVEAVSKGALLNETLRESYLTTDDKNKSVSEQNDIISKKVKEDLTKSIQSYNEQIEQAYIDFAQDPKNKKLLEGLSDDQKKQEFYKGDTSKYNYKTTISDVEVKTGITKAIEGGNLTDAQKEALLNADNFADDIINQANSVIEDLDGKFITAEEALKRFDENIMKALGDVGADSIPSILNARLDLIRASNEELIEIEERSAQKMETMMTGIFGDSAKQIEAINAIRLESAKKRVDSEIKVLKDMEENKNVYTKQQFDAQKAKIAQMNAELLVQEIGFIEDKNNIRQEEIVKQKERLELLNSTEFTYNKNRISILENLDLEYAKNNIKTKKEQLRALEEDGTATKEQIQLFREDILKLEEEYKIKEINLAMSKYQRIYEEREKVIEKHKTKIEQFSDLELIKEEDTQKQINILQKQSIVEYGKLLQQRYELIKQNGGDTEQILIEIQQNEYELEKNLTEKLKMEFEERAASREKYYERLKYEQEVIKENLKSTQEITPQALNYMEQRKNASGSGLEQLGIEKQMLELRTKSLDLEFQLQQRSLEIETNLLNIEKEKRIESEQLNLQYAERLVKQKEELVAAADTPEKLKLANEQLDLAIEKRNEIANQTQLNINRINLEYLAEEKRLSALKETADLQKEIAEIDLSISLKQNKYNAYQERLKIYERLMALVKENNLTEEERYKAEKQQLNYKQKIERELFELENKKYELTTKILEIETEIKKQKIEQENLLHKAENRRLESEQNRFKEERDKLVREQSDGKGNFKSEDSKLKFESLQKKIEDNNVLIDSNLKIIEGNNKLLESQDKLSEETKKVAEELSKLNKTNFNLQQRAERAEMVLSNPNAPYEDRERAKREANYSLNQINTLNSGDYTNKRKPVRLLDLRNSGLEIINKKDGGKVGINERANQIKNSKDPLEVLALGREMIKAMEREGNGAVPIVANKDEYVLNAEETKIFEQLKKLGIWSFFSNKKIQNFKEGGFVTNHRGQQIPIEVHKQLKNAPEGQTTRLTLDGKPAYYLRTKDGVNKVGVGDKYTPSNSQVPFTIKLDSNGLPILFSNNFVYKAGASDKYLKTGDNSPKYHEADPDYQYRTNINRTTAELPIYGYVKNGRRFYKIIKNGKLEPIELRNGDTLLGYKFFKNRTNKLEGYLGFHTAQEWARLNKLDEDQAKLVSSFSFSPQNKNADPHSKFLKSATEEDIQNWNSTTAPRVKGYQVYVASSTYALYRNNTTGKYGALVGYRGEDNRVDPTKLKEVNIKDGTVIEGKVFFDPQSSRLSYKRGFYPNNVYLSLKEEDNTYIQLEDPNFLRKRNLQAIPPDPKARGVQNVSRGVSNNNLGNTLITEYKEGGKVESNTKLDNLVSNAKVNETEVFNLGKEMLKAIYKEGKDAVPLVANKNEYILNEKETKLLKELKNKGIWEQLKQEIGNYKLGGSIYTGVEERIKETELELESLITKKNTSNTDRSSFVWDNSGVSAKERASLEKNPRIQQFLNSKPYRNYGIFSSIQYQSDSFKKLIEDVRKQDRLRLGRMQPIKGLKSSATSTDTALIEKEQNQNLLARNLQLQNNNDVPDLQYARDAMGGITDLGVREIVSSKRSTPPIRPQTNSSMSGNNSSSYSGGGSNTIDLNSNLTVDLKVTDDVDMDKLTRLVETEVKKENERMLKDLEMKVKNRI